MKTRTAVSATTRAVWIVLAIVLLLSAGCIKDLVNRLRGPGFDDSSQRFTSEIPQRENAGRPHSFSTKAQEIEKNFGFQ